MRYSIAFVSAMAASVQAHGTITEIMGANGVNMNGLGVIDGTPLDCPTPSCGAEADTSIIRKNEMGTGKASALGRTEGGGPVDAAKAISIYMGTTPAGGATGAAGGATGSTGGLAGAAGGLKGAPGGRPFAKRGLLGGLFGGAGGKQAGGKQTAAAGGATVSQGTKTPPGTKQEGVAKYAGQGATMGLPTCSDDGTITMAYHQTNQDGAGALTAAIDPTSGGTDPSAFQEAQVTMQVPGIGIGGLSAATTTDFMVKVQMPQGMICNANVGGANKTCIARLQNAALAGPFGGSVAFTQSSAARKRAVEHNLRKRHMARGVLGKFE